MSWLGDAVEALPKLVGFLRGQVDPCQVAEMYEDRAKGFRELKATDMRYHRKEIRAANAAQRWRRRCRARERKNP